MEYEWKRKARTIFSVVEYGIRQLIQSGEHKTLGPHPEMCFFVGGGKYSKEEEDRRKAAAYKRNYKKSSQIITKYFAEIIKPSYYRKYEAKAKELFIKLETDEFLKDKQKVKLKREIEYICEDLAPHYQEGARYKRIFTSSLSIQFLKRDYRKKIFFDCIEIDLVSSQLTLADYLWNIPEVIEFLNSGQSV